MLEMVSVYDQFALMLTWLNSLRDRVTY